MKKKTIMYNVAGIYELLHMDRNVDGELTGYVVAKDLANKYETKIASDFVVSALLKGKVVQY